MKCKIILHFMLILRIFDNQLFWLDLMLLMVELFHYFSFKVCILSLLVNMYIFKISQTYNKSLFQVLIYNLTLIFQSFVKYFHEKILVAALFFLFLSLSLGADYEVMEMNSRKKRGFFPKQTHSQKPLLVLQQLLSFEIF